MSVIRRIDFNNLENLCNVDQMRVVKSDLRVFNVKYYRPLNLITVAGWSVTQDAWVMYCQMLGDIESHLMAKEELNIYFKLNLFNTSSIKYLFKIIKKLNEAYEQGKDVKIYWSCNTENENEIIDAGMDLRGLSDFPFEISYAGETY